MAMQDQPTAAPRVLVLDDQFGASLDDRRSLCRLYGLADETGDDQTPIVVPQPTARAVFDDCQVRYGAVVVNSLEKAELAVAGGWPSSSGEYWALVLLDLRFTSGPLDWSKLPKGRSDDSDFGLLVLQKLLARWPQLPVVVMSSRERDDVIGRCRELGALDFIQKTPDTVGQDAIRILQQKLFQHGLIPDHRMVTAGRSTIVGRSLSLLYALRLARRAAGGTGNVLLLGETGAGKELFARYLHDVSPRAPGPFVIFHPFGTAETLQEDELFGHVRGVFTGAASDRAGLFEQAGGGTIFIDEIGDVPESLQAKLLRPLESRMVARQGSAQTMALDFMAVLATNKDLEEYAARGRFKADLLNRIQAFPVHVPPLRDRLHDIEMLTESLLERLCRASGARWPRRVSPEAIMLLQEQPWSDNVRGLRNALEHAVRNNPDSELLLPRDLEGFLSRSAGHLTGGKRSSSGTLADELGRLAAVQLPADYERLRGAYPVLQVAWCNLQARLLAAALRATGRPVVDKPGECDINLAGAVGCLLGRKVTTAQAADFVKRCLLQAGVEPGLGGEPLLRCALAAAVRLRGGPAQARKARPQSRR